MKQPAVGSSVPRVDGYEKVTGQALYTDDFRQHKPLIAKIVHATIANGMVKRFDLQAAKAVSGVRYIFTCFDVPDIQFPTAGHPWSTDAAHQDVADRKLLNERVRYYGDEIAVVVAEDEISATRGMRAVQVEYEEFSPLLCMQDSMRKGATPIHKEYPDNILATSSYEIGKFEEAIQEEGLLRFEHTYHVPMVQHAHIENPCVISYAERNRIVVISSTQVPTIVQRVVGQALGIPWGDVRVIKPCVGGGFGNKQEVLFEPLAAFITQQTRQCVKIDTTREETFSNTRTRHAMDLQLTTYVRKDGTLAARKLHVWSNQGAYASHGHSVVAGSASIFRQIYPYANAIQGTAHTVYTNLPTAGAMRAYGVPQIMFAVESQMEEIAQTLGIDSCELRLKNALREGYHDPYLVEIASHTNGLEACIRRGKELIGWGEKRAAYQNQTGNLRKGVGMSIFCYKTGVHPISLESASCRLSVNQDGSIDLAMGATEIGQGADTVFCQMAADSVGVPVDRVHILSMQDTDTSPFDSGAYASRQSYVSGMAVRDAAALLRDQIFEYARSFFKLQTKDALDLQQGFILCNGKELTTLADLSMEALYSLKHSTHFVVEHTTHCKTNALCTGVSFAEVEVDIALGKVKVKNLVSVHDSGKLINPQLAQMQVHGGQSMSLGYALYEQLLFDPQTGKPLNNNLLDYKLMTASDTPDLTCDFIELHEPTAPYGNKALGEPPAVAPAPAVRNALLHATGVAIDRLPMTPEVLIAAFDKAGLLEEQSHV